MSLNTPSAYELRDMYPGLVLKLDHIYLVEELNSLEIYYDITSGPKAAEIKIMLQNNFMLRIKPVDKGSRGYAEWLSWGPLDGSNTSLAESVSIRAHIELVDFNLRPEKAILSFTAERRTIKELIKFAQFQAQDLRGLEIIPTWNEPNDKKKHEN